MEPTKYVFLCSTYPKEYDDFYKKLAGDDSTVSGNIHSLSIIDGLKKAGIPVFVISGVGVGHYPLNSKVKKLPEIKYNDDFYSVSYNNNVLISQQSKAKAMYECFIKHCPFKSEPVNILLADIHEPFAKAALKIKKHNKDSRIVNICLDVPDTIISSKKSFIRNVLKKISIRRNLKLLKKMDGYILLSEKMKEKLPVENKPCFVSPCIADTNQYVGYSKNKTSKTKIVYCGVLSKQYNIDLLLNAFALSRDNNYELILAGKGDGVDLIKEFAEKDFRIKYLGEVTRTEATQIQLDADILVNPRLPETNYTSYSFPSKTISYLLSGNPVVCYTFSSFPDEIKKMVYEPDKLDADSFLKEIICCSNKQSKVDYNVLKKYSQAQFVNELNKLFAEIRKQHE